MLTLKLNSKGQLTIPRNILAFYHWEKGKKFNISDRGGEIVIKPVSEFPPSTLESPDTPSVYKGKPLTLEDMDNAVRTEADKNSGLFRFNKAARFVKQQYK